ncbi:MAG: MotA/TolQ/ExbB proton channel family protein [Myxococcota bacterium]
MTVSSRCLRTGSFAILCGAMFSPVALAADVVVNGADDKASSPSTTATPVAATKTTPAGDTLLQRAYQKELAILVAERRELQRRLETVAQEEAAQRKRAEEEQRALEDHLVALTLRADASEARLADIERAGTAMLDGQEAIATILQQAARDADGAPAELPEASSALGVAFRSSLEKMRQQSTLRTASGTWFDVSGKEVTGTVLRIGAVAAFGKAEGASGALAPAGGTALKVWHESNAQAAADVVDGKTPSTLGLLLFEPTTTALEAKKEKSPLDIVIAGGVIAWVIVGLGLFALFLVALRALLLWWRGRGSESLFARVPSLVAGHQVEEALGLCRRRSASMGRVLAAVIEARHLSREQRSDRVDQQILDEVVAIDRFGAMILVFAGVAPLLGLLGTVTGMIATFDAITEFGTGDPRLLSGGISEALITTELGLVVAIPSLLLGNLLSGLGERLKRRLEGAALRTSNAVDDLLTMSGTVAAAAPRPTTSLAVPLATAPTSEAPRAVLG